MVFSHLMGSVGFPPLCRIGKCLNHILPPQHSQKQIRMVAVYHRDVTNLLGPRLAKHVENSLVFEGGNQGTAGYIEGLAPFISIADRMSHVCSRDDSHQTVLVVQYRKTVYTLTRELSRNVSNGKVNVDAWIRSDHDVSNRDIVRTLLM